MGKSGKLLKSFLESVKSLKSPSKEKTASLQKNPDRPTNVSKEKPRCSSMPSTSLFELHNNHNWEKDVPFYNHHDYRQSPSLSSSRCGEEERDLAAIKIQTLFRAYQARVILKSLRGVVRVQAIVRGHIVQRRAKSSLLCLQAIVKVQAHIRGCRVRMSGEGQGAIQRRKKQINTTLEAIDAPMQALNAKATANVNQLKSINVEHSKNYGEIEFNPDGKDWRWVWLDRWMAVRPWESSFASTQRENSKHISCEKNVALMNTNALIPNPTEYEEICESSTFSSTEHAFSKAALPTLLANSNGNTLGDGITQNNRNTHQGRSKNEKDKQDDEIGTNNVRNGTAKTENGVVINVCKTVKGGKARDLKPTSTKSSIISGSNKLKSTKLEKSENTPFSSFSSSSLLPNYMVATQSAKAKARLNGNIGQKPKEANSPSQSTKRRSSTTGLDNSAYKGKGVGQEEASTIKASSHYPNLQEGEPSTTRRLSE